jgi:hypothetical protein
VCVFEIIIGNKLDLNQETRFTIIKLTLVFKMLKLLFCVVIFKRASLWLENALAYFGIITGVFTILCCNRNHK